MHLYIDYDIPLVLLYLVSFVIVGYCSVNAIERLRKYPHIGFLYFIVLYEGSISKIFANATALLD